MKRKNRIFKTAGIITAAMLTLVFYMIAISPSAYAADTVYNCKINPCYSHPVTGAIEDAGGSTSEATGQGMAESALGKTGTLSKGTDGNYNLTFTMNLIDYTSKRSLWVQEAGDSDWEKVTADNTATGKDSNGTTKDYRIKVPSESCIVKVSMYVDPMGRDVIFYFYPSDYTLASGSGSKDTSTGSQSSGSDDKSGTASDGTANDGSGNKTVGTSDSGTGSTTAGTSDSGSGSTTAGTSSTSGNEADGTTDNTSDNQSSGTITGSGTLNESTGIVNTGNSSQASSGETEQSLGQASGLSLSTESEAAASVSAGGQTSSGSSHPYICLFFTIVLSGAMLILMGVLAVYYCRRNWKKWGGTYEDDDES